MQRLRGSARRNRRDALAAVDEQAAQIVDAVRVVGMLVRVEHRVDPIDVGVKQLLAQIRRRVDQDAGDAVGLARRSTRSEQRRRRFLGLSGSQTPQPSAGRGTPPDEPQPRMVNSATCVRSRDCVSASARRHWARVLREQPEEVVRRLAGELIEARRRASRRDLGGFGHERPARCACRDAAGREIRRVGLDEKAVGRQRGCDRAQLLGLLERHDAGERDVDAERDRPARPASRPAGEAMQHDREAPCPVSSSRMRAMSSSARANG